MTLSEDEAERLWLARIAAAPDQWRTRATSAAGLLSSAAAATLIAVFARSDQLPANAGAAGVAAGALYGLAVLAYLLGSVTVRKKKRPPDQPGDTQVDKLSNRSAFEAAPVKVCVLVGTGLAAAAIIATALSIGLAVFGDVPYTSGTVTFVSSGQEERVQDLCVGFNDETPAQFRRAGDLLDIRLAASTCGGNELVVTIPADEALLRPAS